jgi:hypothetical protein
LADQTLQAGKAQIWADAIKGQCQSGRVSALPKVAVEALKTEWQGSSTPRADLL